MVVGDLTTAVDVVVLGAGPGGCAAAIRAAQLGQIVAIVDPGPPGGACLHDGCVPAKALLWAADQAARVPTLAELGILVGRARVDLCQMQDWKNALLDRLAEDMRSRLQAHGVEIVEGSGRFTGPREVRVAKAQGSHKISFEACVIAVGCEPRPLPGLPFDGERVLAPAEALRLKILPPSFAIVGADAIAAEVATFFAKVGAPVRLLLPNGERLLPEFDPLAGKRVAESLARLGARVEPLGDDPAAAAAEAGCVVVSAGVQPRIADLDLGAIGLAPAPDGCLRPDRRQRVAEGIYAVGDVTGGLPLASVAIKQGKVAAGAIAGQPVEFAPQAVPRVAWTDPEVAAVGLTAGEAEAAGYEVVAGRCPLAAGADAATFSAPAGDVLVVAERGSEVVLGVTIVGAQASSLIGEAALAIEMGATLTDLAETLHARPSPGEALGEAAEIALGIGAH